MAWIRQPHAGRKFAIATLAFCCAAWLQTQAAHVPGRPRLQYPIFQRLFAFVDQWGAAAQIAVVVLVLLIPALRRYGNRLAVVLTDHPRMAAAASCAILAAAALFSYRNIPFAMDEYAQLAQAYAFAHGHLSWFEPPRLLDRMIPAGFRNYFLAVDAHTGEVASLYWPGFAALLTPFALAGVPWLLNPLLGGISVLLVHAIARKVCADREAAGWAVLLTLASPAFTVNCLSFYSMSAHLALNLTYAWLLLDGRASRALLAGCVGSIALVLHNPVPHTLFAIPWLLWMLYQPARRSHVALVILGYLPVSIVVGCGWPLLTGSIANAGTAAHGVGGVWQAFAAKVAGIVKLPDRGLVLARLDATCKLWIWSVPGLLILTLSGLRALRGPLLLFAISAALTYCVYWLFPFDQGHGWGYRYMHSAWAALPLLAAAVLTASPDAHGLGGLRHWAGGFALASLICLNGFWFWQVRTVIDEHLAQRIPVPAKGRWVEFVRVVPGLYTWDLIQNLPYDSRQILLVSFGASADETLVQKNFPSAKRVILDPRGSLWSLP